MIRGLRLIGVVITCVPFGLLAAGVFVHEGVGAAIVAALLGAAAWTMWRKATDSLVGRPKSLG